jgi:hypothetical protein
MIDWSRLELLPDWGRNRFRVLLLFSLVLIGVAAIAVVMNISERSERSRDVHQIQPPPGTAPTPAPTPAQARPATPPPPQTRSICDVDSEVTYTREWIRSCRLLGKLTEECKQIFDIDGNYLAPERAGSYRIQQWLNDATACSCTLPPKVATPLNESLKSDKELCAARFPEPSKAK